MTPGVQQGCRRCRFHYPLRASRGKGCNFCTLCTLMHPTTPATPHPITRRTP